MKARIYSDTSVASIDSNPADKYKDRAMPQELIHSVTRITGIEAGGTQETGGSNVA